MATKKRKKYMVTTNSEAYACSLVTSPAVEELFVAFNEETPIIEKFADEKKRMITGVVAIPNKPIFRRTEDGEEFDIVFSEEAIEKMSKDFLKDYRQHEVTLQHQENADGVYLVEQWIKTDMVYDKSIAVGLSKELPVGSWIQTYYVDSNDVWQRIMDGELRGFSLEAMIGLEEFSKQIEEQNINNMEIQTNDMFWEKLKNILKEAFSKKEEEKVEEPTEIEPTNIDLEAEPQPEPVVEPSEPQTEPEPTTTKVEENNEPVEPTPQEPQPKVEEPKDNHLEELINSLKEEIAALKTSNGELQEKIKDLSSQPSAKPISVHSGNGNATDTTGVNSSTFQNWRKEMSRMINGY